MLMNLTVFLNKKHLVVSCRAQTLGPKSNKETLRVFALGVKPPGVPPCNVDGLPTVLLMQFPVVIPWPWADRFYSRDHQHFRWCCDMARIALWCLHLPSPISPPSFISSYCNIIFWVVFSAKIVQTLATKTSRHRKPTTMIEVSRCWWWKSSRPQCSKSRMLKATRVWWEFHEIVMGM